MRSARQKRSGEDFGKLDQTTSLDERFRSGVNHRGDVEDFLVRRRLNSSADHLAKRSRHVEHFIVMTKPEVALDRWRVSINALLEMHAGFVVFITDSEVGTTVPDFSLFEVLFVARIKMFLCRRQIDRRMQILREVPGVTINILRFAISPGGDPDNSPRLSVRR